MLGYFDVKTLVFCIKKCFFKEKSSKILGNLGGGIHALDTVCCVSKPGSTTPSVAAEARRRSVERHGPTATPPTEMEKKKNLSF